MDTYSTWDPGFAPPEVPIETVREAARRRVTQTSLRTVARAVGISPETARKFLDGAQPYQRGRALWQAWYAREHARPPRPLASGPGGALAAPLVPGGAPGAGDRVWVRLASARRAFPTDAELAEALGVDRALPARWRSGEGVDAAALRRLLALDVVVELLSRHLGPGALAGWLRAPHPRLDGRRPLDLLREGALSPVIAAIEAEEGAGVA